jgi:hypothetical protein
MRPPRAAEKDPEVIDQAEKVQQVQAREEKRTKLRYTYPDAMGRWAA